MGWETRRNGRRYFYKTVRLPDGRSSKRYYGCGELARQEDERLQRRRKARQEFQELVRAVAAAEALFNEFQVNAQRAIAEEMALYGYSNPGSRGWRRTSRHESS